MVDVNVDFIFENEQPINADFQLEPDVTYTADILLSSASSFHNELYNRDLPDQHPMSAITGLEDALEGLSDDITAENNRAIEAEEALDNKIDSEADTRADEITRVEGLISDEEARASGAEATLQANITDEENRAKGVEQQLTSSIDSNHQAISNHVSDKNNPHEVTKAQVGLGNVENLAPADMPISTATQTALNTKVDKVSTANKVYGTDAQGNQTTYDKGSFGQVDDVRVGGVSVVTNKIANLGTMAGETASDYPTLDGNNTFTGDNELTGTISATMEGAEGEEQSGLYMDNTGLSIYSEGEYSGVSVYVSPVDGLTVQNAAYGLDYSDTSFIANGYGVTCSSPLGNSDGEVVNVGYANDHYATTAQGALADTALQPNDNISELTNNLNYQTATQVANSIAVETSNRESADNNLQSQIDAIVSASDVFDIVGTYAELQAYDISTVPVNDIIKVLADSTHAGAATYYRCVENNNVKSWSYIGSEGASYTKAEADNKFVPQTRMVNNKALSSDITLTATDVGALPSSTVIPTVNDATVTIQKNGSTVSTFTLNQSSNETVNITVPTKTSEITNDSGYITSSSLPTVNNGQLDIQVNGSSVATFTANQSGNTTADITIPSSLPDQTGNAGKVLSTDGTDASWEYKFINKGNYNNNVQYYPGDIVQYYYQGAYHKYLCKQPTLGFYPSDSLNDYWLDLRGYIRLNQYSGDYYLLPYTPDGWGGNAVAGVNLIVPQNQTLMANQPRVNTYSGLLKVPGGIDGYSPDSAFGATAFSNDYSDLDNKPSIPTATSDLTNDSGFITVSALIGYATESWVTNKGYITGISSSDVTTALGYTPYNSSNPAGYITSSALTPYALSSSLSAVATSGAYADLSGTPTIPTVNNPTITITQGGTTKGSFSLNQASGDTIALDAGGIQNTATGTDSLSILGTASTYNQTVNVGVGSSNTGYNSTAVGYNTTAHEDGVAIGMNATASNYDAIAIGRDASVSGNNSIQLGYGTLTTNNIFQVWDYPLLDYSSGEIPDARISPNIARTSALPSITIQKVNSLPASPSSNILYCIPES